jgi:hypothetical protein
MAEISEQQEARRRMRQDFNNYMKYIGLSPALTGRVQDFYGFWRMLCPEKIEWMFINDSIDKDGARLFESLLFFSANYGMEAKDFVSKENFHMVRIESPIVLFSVQTQDYDFKQATEKSRLYFRASLTASTSATLKAAKENCDCLWELVVNYFAPISRK